MQTLNPQTKVETSIEKRSFSSCKRLKTKTTTESTHCHVISFDKMADNLPASLLVFISNLLVIYQLNVFIILLTNLSYARERQLCLDYVSSSSRLVMRRPRLWRQQRRPRRFWIKPGRTQSWWDSFSNNSSSRRVEGQF